MLFLFKCSFCLPKGGGGCLTPGGGGGNYKVRKANRGLGNVSLFLPVI